MTIDQTRISNEIKILLNDVEHLETNIERMKKEADEKIELIEYFKQQIK